MNFTKEKVIRIFVLTLFLVQGVVDKAFAVADLSQAVSKFTSALEEPIKIGAGLVFVYGVVNLVMAIKEDNPQSKSSAIKSMIAGGVLYTIATQLSSLV